MWKVMPEWSQELSQGFQNNGKAVPKINEKVIMGSPREPFFSQLEQLMEIDTTLQWNCLFSTSGRSQKHLKAKKKSLRKRSTTKYKFGITFEVIWGPFRVLETVLGANCEPKVHQKSEKNVSNGSQKSALISWKPKKMFKALKQCSRAFKKWVWVVLGVRFVPLCSGMLVF